MAVEGIINSSSDMAPVLISELGHLALWLQAIGGIILLWLIFNVISLVVNLKRKRELEKMRDDLKRIEQKLDSLLRSKKNR